MECTINEERISAEEYIEFLKHTDLGPQYPKERFQERIATLLERASISLVARDTEKRIVGICFGITDFAYWLFITDLGIVREYTGARNRNRIGQKASHDRRRRRQYHHVYLL